MSWRTVVITSSAKLDYQLGFLVIRKEDIIKIHLSEIAILILETTAVSMTAQFSRRCYGRKYQEK